VGVGQNGVQAAVPRHGHDLGRRDAVTEQVGRQAVAASPRPGPNMLFHSVLCQAPIRWKGTPDERTHVVEKCFGHAVALLVQVLWRQQVLMIRYLRKRGEVHVNDILWPGLADQCDHLVGFARDGSAHGCAPDLIGFFPIDGGDQRGKGALKVSGFVVSRLDAKGFSD